MTCQITLGGKMHQNLTLLAVTPLGSSTARHPQEPYFYRIIVLLFFYISAQCEHFHGRPEAILYVHSGHTYWIVCTCRRGEERGCVSNQNTIGARLLLSFMYPLCFCYLIPIPRYSSLMSFWKLSQEICLWNYITLSSIIVSSVQVGPV